MKKPIKILFAVFAVLMLLAAGAALFLYASYPDPADYAEGSHPRIHIKPDVLSLQTEFDGDPEIVIEESFSRLFKAYYSTKGVPKGPGQPPPIARYEGFTSPEIFDNDSLYSNAWKGFAAIPIPQNAVLPAKRVPRVHASVLEYGEVAEIVHFGRYEDEHMAIRTLLNFIDEQNYTITGLHEEEYVLGPGMLFIKPDDYVTIIRYQVAKK